MIFVIEKLVQDHQNRVEAWEKARNEWCNESAYNNRREYEENHPRPGHWVRVLGKILIIKLCIALAAFMIIGWVREVKSQPHKPQTPAKVVTYKNGDKCGSFYVGDTGSIKYGDYEGAQIEITGGCGKNEDYQVVTIADQILHGQGSASESDSDTHIMPGIKFSVNTASNLIITGHKKD